MFMLLPSVVLVSWSGGAGVHVQPDCGNRSSDDAQSLRHSRLGGQLGSHFLFRIYEVSVDLTPTPVCVQHVENMQWKLEVDWFMSWLIIRAEIQHFSDLLYWWLFCWIADKNF